MMDASDDRLKRAMGGDREALTGLLEQYASGVRQRIANGIPKHLRSVLSEDDVMQQTYTDAFCDIGRFSPQGDDAFARWLATLAGRNLLDAVRMLEAEKRGGKRQQVVGPVSDESLVALYEVLAVTTSTPSRYAARGEAKSAMANAIRQLPDIHRRVIEMYDLEGRSVEEVATALERSPGAVFMLRARAHRRLAEFMGPSSNFLSGAS